MEFYTERDINDMDEKINNLQSVVGRLDGAVSSVHIEAIEAVIDEWAGSTKPLLEGLAEKLDA